MALVINGYRTKHATVRILQPKQFQSALLCFGPYDCRMKDIRSWTLEQRARIIDFVMDQHYSAGDHIVRNKRPKPDFFQIECC